MLKFIASTLVASSVALTAGQEALASGGSSWGGKRACAPAPAAASDTQPSAPRAPAAKPDMPGKDMPPAPPATAQNTRSQYRSYSYDPATTYRAPVTRSYGRPSSQQNQFSANRKMFGLQ